MSFYLYCCQEDHQIHTQLWHFDGKAAKRIDITNPPVVETKPGETAQELFKRVLLLEPPRATIHEMQLRPGEYYPRMARPTTAHPYDRPVPGRRNTSFAHEIASLKGQLTVLTLQLERICRTVHPTKENFNSFGHDIRNLIILASAEVETHWKGVLAANGEAGSSTKDYVKLLRPMRLDEYEVSFPSFPWMEPIAPFKNWTAPNTTQSLGWYDAYNLIKHDREKNFYMATLLHAFYSVAACIVMMYAQFGYAEVFAGAQGFRQYFTLTSTPVWDLSEIYIGQESALSAVNYKF